MFYTDSDKAICLVLEYLPHNLEGTLRPKLKKQDPNKEASDSDEEPTTDVKLDFAA